MELESIVNSIIDIYSGGLNDLEKSLVINEAVQKFNEEYIIVPKEQWCVLFYTPWDGGNPEVTGPFNSEEEAKLFIENWEAKREANIEQYLKENPNKDIDDIPSGPNLVAKKLKFNNTNREIIDKIRQDSIGVKDE